MAIAENDDENNCSAAETQVTVGHPDLRQISITTSAIGFRGTGNDTAER